jgi:hypothetical protein
VGCATKGIKRSVFPPLVSALYPRAAATGCVKAGSNAVLPRQRIQNETAIAGAWLARRALTSQRDRAMDGGKSFPLSALASREFAWRIFQSTALNSTKEEAPSSARCVGNGCADAPCVAVSVITASSYAHRFFSALLWASPWSRRGPCYADIMKRPRRTSSS